MIKKFTLTGKHYELGYGNIIKKDTWLIKTKEGKFETAPFILKLFNIFQNWSKIYIIIKEMR